MGRPNVGKSAIFNRLVGRPISIVHDQPGVTRDRIAAECRPRDGIPYELTRRGGIRADLKGRIASPDRSIVAHLDTLGAMVSGLKENGRLRLTPIGTWSSRFAEGAHAWVYGDEAKFSGTILPIKAAGHVYDEEIDQLPVSWDTVEFRVDHPEAVVAKSRQVVGGEFCFLKEGLPAAGREPGSHPAGRGVW